MGRILKELMERRAVGEKLAGSQLTGKHVGRKETVRTEPFEACAGEKRARSRAVPD